MNCQDVQDRLDRYAAGTLSPELRADVERHLAGCGACRAEAARLVPLLADAARLPRSIEPPRDLWPEVAARIREKKVVSPAFGGGEGDGRRPWWSRPAALAAAAAALVVLSSTATTLVVRRPTADGRAGVATAALPGDFLALEAEYAGAAEEILYAVRQGRVKIRPETRRVLERNLRIIDEAIRESREALSRDPANRELRQMILTAYQHKLDLLRRAASAASA